MLLKLRDEAKTYIQAMAHENMNQALNKLKLVMYYKDLKVYKAIFQYQLSNGKTYWIVAAADLSGTIYGCMHYNSKDRAVKVAAAIKDCIASVA